MAVGTDKANGTRVGQPGPQVDGRGLKALLIVHHADARVLRSQFFDDRARAIRAAAVDDQHFELQFLERGTIEAMAAAMQLLVQGRHDDCHKWLAVRGHWPDVSGLG